MTVFCETEFLMAIVSKNSWCKCFVLPSKDVCIYNEKCCLEIMISSIVPTLLPDTAGLC